MMIFVPTSYEDARALRAGRELAAAPGCAATESLIAALGPGTSAEEAEYAALNNAGVLAIMHTAESPRLVLAAEVADDQVTDRRTELGEIDVGRLSWSQVQSLFTDESAAGEAVNTARRDAAGKDLAQALGSPAVGDLLDAYDLLWFATSELDRLRVAD
jgi:hypothetical protein